MKMNGRRKNVVHYHKPDVLSTALRTQTDRHTCRQTYTNRQTHRRTTHTDRQTHVQTNIHKQTDTQTHYAHRQTDTYADKQTQTDRHTDTHMQVTFLTVMNE